IDEKRWAKAWELSKKYNDKTSISFFDFTSFVVMKEIRISEALTNDKHFEEVGMGFRKLF
ncbi:MAG: PIN domain-containing protein, partial [Nitrospiraceae bacterium]|nr:PIN domain-containing protein [Nitrospiraceae bacterium]